MAEKFLEEKWADGNSGDGNFGDGNSGEETDPVAVIGLKSCVLGILILWTVGANGMVFVVLYKFPRLRTVPNFLVANLAFSDFTLGLLVLPFSAVYAITSEWLSGKSLCELWLSLDIFLCTSSIWNLSMIGLDRYWAITDPVRYLSKRTLKTAIIMISCVWALAGAISVAPFLGWKAFSKTGNFYHENQTNSMQCMHFQDLPSFTVYSATGSFWIPLVVMLYVYYRIYKAFREHRANRIYRQKVSCFFLFFSYFFF